MDFFNHPYYVTIKTMNVLLGFWPYQDRWKNTVCRSVVIFMFITQLTGQIICFIVYIDDKDVVIEVIITTLTAAFSGAKCINSIFKMKTMTKLVENIKEDHTIFTRNKEKLILDKHANIGRLFVHGYLLIAYATVILFITEPSIPYLDNLIFHSNNTISHKYPVPIHWYIIDMDKNFYPLWGYESICIVVVMTGGLASDSSFIIFLQHARGLFVLVQDQFQHLPNINDLEAEWSIHKKFRKTNDIQYDYYTMCIKNHKRAFEFASLLENMYVWCFGLVIGMSVPLISFTIFQLLTYSNTTQQMIKLVMFIVIQFLHLFFDCYLSQRLIDESNNIQQYITLSDWYKLPIDTQKLIILATLRSQRPCAITAGKLATLSMETFGTIIKTAVSYLTVLMALK